MKYLWAILFILAAGLIAIYLAINFNTEEISSGNNGSELAQTQARASEFSFARNCNGLRYPGYPGARAIAYQKEPGCFEVYMAAFAENKKEVCDILSSSDDRALCYGAAVASLGDISRCSDIEQEDICFLNAAKKVNRMNISKSIGESLSICDKIQNYTLKLACYGFSAYRFDAPEICNLNEKENLVCLHDYLEGKAQALRSVAESNINVPICNSLFKEEENLLACYDLAVPNYWLMINQTTHGNMTFYNLTQITKKTRQLLTIKKESNKEGYVSYASAWYLCNAIFEEETDIPTFCFKLPCAGFGDSCLVGYPRFWGYYDTYFAP